MTTTVAFPFLTLTDDVVALDPWLIAHEGSELKPILPVLDAWDYATNVALQSSISIDMGRAGALLGIAVRQLELEVVFRAGTGRGRFPRVTWELGRWRVGPDTSWPVAIQGVVPGAELSGRLYGRVDLLLAVVPSDPSSLSPTRLGSRLWSKEFSVELEDSGDNRFPIELLSFARTFPQHIGAPWYLRWQAGDLKSDFSGAVRLYVNADLPGLAGRVTEGDPITLQVMLGDVMVQLIGTAVESDDVIEQLADCEEGSVGAQVKVWMDLAFPGRTPVQVSSLRQSNPSDFHSSIYRAAQLEGGV